MNRFGPPPEGFDRRAGCWMAIVIYLAPWLAGLALWWWWPL